MNNVITLFNSEDKNEIKEAIKELILKQVKDELESGDFYLVDSNQIEDMVQDVIEEVKEDFKEIYKDRLMKQLEEKLKEI